MSRGGRWVYTEGGRPILNEAGELAPVEVGQDWRNVTPITGDGDKFAYSNLRASDGTDISSPTKRREYMQRSGVVDSRDFTETLAHAKAERARVVSGDADHRERREAVGRALYESRKRRR